MGQSVVVNISTYAEFGPMSSRVLVTPRMSLNSKVGDFSPRGTTLACAAGGDSKPQQVFEAWHCQIKIATSENQAVRALGCFGELDFVGEFVGEFFGEKELQSLLSMNG